MKLVAALLAFAALTACGRSTPPPATPVPPPKAAKEPPTAPASREPLYVEFIAIHKAWVTKYVPEGAEKAGDAMKRLGAEMTKHLHSSPDMREAIADSVGTVLGDSAVADPDRPQMSVVDREQIKLLKHLSAAAKAGLGAFADHAHPGDILETPVAEDDVVIVARAVAAAG